MEKKMTNVKKLGGARTKKNEEKIKVSRKNKNNAYRYKLNYCRDDEAFAD